MFLRGVSYSAEAYELAPQSISWGRWLSTGLRNVAVKQASFGERDTALRSYQKYVAVRRKLAFENPAVPSLKGELHQAHMDLASYQRELNLTAEADRSLKAAQDVLENIPAIHRPRCSTWQSSMAPYHCRRRVQLSPPAQTKSSVDDTRIWRWRRLPRRSRTVTATSTR